MMKNDSQSIQQLLAAEKKADEKVNQARKRKINRLKQAKEEAQTEVQNFRAEKEAGFKDYETKYLGTRAIDASRVDVDTTNAIREMEELVNAKKDQVTDYLLNQVFTINCEVHENFQKK